MVVPGDNATLEIELISPLAMAEGLRFALREGGKTVGAGVVAKVIEQLDPLFYDDDDDDNDDMIYD